MIQELDPVVLTRDVPEHGLEKGDVGAVATAMRTAPPSKSSLCLLLSVWRPVTKTDPGPGVDVHSLIR